MRKNCFLLALMAMFFVPSNLNASDDWPTSIVVDGVVYSIYYGTGWVSGTTKDSSGALDKIKQKVNYNGTQVSIHSLTEGSYVDLHSVIIPDFIYEFNTPLDSPVDGMEENPFKYCGELESIVVDKNNRYFDSRDNCNAIIKTSSNVLLSGCKNTIIPNTVTSIGKYAFSGCTGLSSITIPDNVTSIGEMTFASCRNLSSITFPEGIKGISETAFYNCDNIIDIYWYAPYSISIRIFMEWGKMKNTTLHVASENLKSYMEDDNVRNKFKAIVPIDDGTVYNLTYYVDGQVYKVFNYKYGDDISQIEPPVKEGYTFSGWDYVPSTMPDHDVDVTGKFVVNKYKLVYMVDGVEYRSYDVEYSTAIKPEEEPTKEGCTFSGWSEIPATMPAHDVTVTGTFVDNNTKYILTYMVDGEIYRSYRLKAGSTIIPIDEPTKDGYTFSGWSDIPEEMPAHAVTITGSFTMIPLGKCESPTVKWEDGKIMFGCETEDVEFNYEIKSNISLSGKGSGIPVTPSISVSVYTSKEGYDNSDVVTKDIMISAGDSNGDETINAADIVTIVNMIMSAKE